MTRLIALSATATLFLSGIGAANAADLYPWRNHAAPFNFLFQNEIDGHQQTRQTRDRNLFGFFYVEFTGVVTKDQLVRFYQNLSRRRWRKEEPLDDELAPESPVLFERASKYLAQERVLPFHEVFTRTRLPKGYLETLAGLESGTLTNVFSEQNVVQFRRKSDSTL